jgi:hypothetical protein
MPSLDKREGEQGERPGGTIPTIFLVIPALGAYFAAWNAYQHARKLNGEGTASLIGAITFWRSLGHYLLAIAGALTFETTLHA